MAFFSDSNPLYTLENLEPYPSTTDLLPVVSGRTILLQIPNEFQKVVVSDPSAPLVQYFETTGLLTQSTFYRVDYKNGGIVYLDSSQNGKTLQFNYYSKGVMGISSRRVITDNNADPTETLQSFIDATGQDLQQFKNDTNQTYSDFVESTNNSYDDYVNTTDLRIQYTDSIMISKFSEIDVKIADTEVARQNAIVATTNASNATTLANTAYTTTLTIPKVPVATYSQITSVYSNPSVGWEVVTLDTGNKYRYSGSAWIENGNVNRGGILVGSSQPSDNSIIWIDINS